MRDNCSQAVVHRMEQAISVNVTATFTGPVGYVPSWDLIIRWVEAPGGFNGTVVQSGLMPLKASLSLRGAEGWNGTISIVVAPERGSPIPAIEQRVALHQEVASSSPGNAEFMGQQFRMSCTATY
ncbi:MAG: hypothetical protein V4510_12190 [bacterium]